MTEEGNHGGDTELEFRTTLFAYQKKPFPMGNKYRKNMDQFAQMDKAVKQSDLAAIGATLMNVPIPFSNLGVVHPAFAPTGDLKQAVSLLRENIGQIETYLKKYCDETSQPWCADELGSFEKEITTFDSTVTRNDKDQLR